MQENKKPLAHIIIGFIGSGKTTFARKLEQETGAVRFTKDEWMVRVLSNTPPKDKFEEYDNRMTSLAADMALKCLKAGISVIIDEKSFNHYWKHFQPPDKDEEFTLINQE